LPGDQLRQRAVVSVEVDVTGDTADRSSGADLPVGPGVGAAGGGTPTVVAAAGAPWVASVEVLAIVAGDPGRQRDVVVQVSRVACADIDDRAQGQRGLGLDVRGPVIIPNGIAAFRTANTGEFFAIHHWEQCFAVIRGDAAAGTSPEVVNLSAGATFGRVSEVIRTHLQAGAFSAAGVARPIGIVTGCSFSATCEREGDTVTFNARPGDVALIAGYIDAEKAVGGVVRENRRSSKGQSCGGNNAKCVLD